MPAASNTFILKVFIVYTIYTVYTEHSIIKKANKIYFLIGALEPQ